MDRLNFRKKMAVFISLVMILQVVLCNVGFADGITYTVSFPNNVNVNGLTIPIKRHRMADWIKKRPGPSIRCLHETHFRSKDTERLQGRGSPSKEMRRELCWQYCYQTKQTLYSKDCNRDKEGHYIMITRRYNIVNIYAPNTGATKNIKQI